MAMSLPRSDPASPAQVADASFSTGRRGFDQNEVRDFLGMVAAELGRLHERERFLERELQNAQTNPDLDASRLDDEALTRLLGQETARVLNAARESAHEIREKAEQSAARMLMEASEETLRLREEAEIEASRRRSDAANDADAELSMAKQQGREMVNEARAYRERVLSELARRRELAREQIEQLVHGRDRLMQVFERARLVAVDVVAEMQPLGEPDEYVNLQASTGPVPVMVARDEVHDERRVVDDVESSDSHDDALDAGEPNPGSDAIDDANDADDEVVEQVEVAEQVDPVEHDVIGTSAREAGDDDMVTGSDDGPADRGNVVDTDLDAAQVDTGQGDILDVDAPHGSNRDFDRGSVDDVVVDLFARLRADAEESDAEESDAEESDDRAHEEQADDEHSDDDQPSGDEHSVGDQQSGDQQSDAQAADDAGDLVDAAHSDTVDDPSDTDDSKTDDSVDPVIDLDAEAGTSVDAEHRTGAGVDTTVDADDETTVFDQRDADLTPLVVASARRLKRVLADEQNEVLDALRRNDPVRTLDDLLPWASEHTERYASMISEDLLLAANAGASMIDPDRVAKLSKAKGRSAVAHASEMIGRWLVEPLRDRLERCVSDGDGDNPAITKKVRAVYREWKTQHIDEQLDDVVRAAHARGVLAALGPDAPVLWTPDPSHQACPDCDDNRLAGAVAAGQEFPTSHTSTPAHPGCRCMLVPVRR